MFIFIKLLFLIKSNITTFWINQKKQNQNTYFWYAQ
jgi:hypothetical protein